MSISDTEPMEALVEQVTDYFDAQMRNLYQEVPERFEEQTNEMWNAQCGHASMVLMTQIHALVEQVELCLVTDAEYYKESVLRSHTS